MATPTTTTIVKNGTIIAPCNCKHTFQDTQYGKGMRVWNTGKEGRICTVCLASVR